MVRVPVLTSTQEAVVMAVKAFEALVLFEDQGKGMETALEWLGGSPRAYGVFFGMIREMVRRDVPADPASYVSSVKESAIRHFGVEIL